jgi:hypothetical protein
MKGIYSFWNMIDLSSWVSYRNNTVNVPILTFFFWPKISLWREMCCDYGKTACSVKYLNFSRMNCLKISKTIKEKAWLLIWFRRNHGIIETSDVKVQMSQFFAVFILSVHEVLLWSIGGLNILYPFLPIQKTGCTSSLAGSSEQHLRLHF